MTDEHLELRRSYLALQAAYTDLQTRYDVVVERLGEATTSLRLVQLQQSRLHERLVDLDECVAHVVNAARQGP